ncbi:MAG: hypothetical protein JRF33_12500 [Deltaproteobacteria bacterium]|nr:hypothetical protein [Deltaproteobacteria bacterium]
MSEKKKGNYFGTEIDRKWWKRFRKDGLFARGNGDFWMDEEGIRFHRKMTKTPFLLTWAELSGAELGRWHAGRWGGRRPLLKLDFERDGKILCAGFYLAADWVQMESLAKDLDAKIRKS